MIAIEERQITCPNCSELTGITIDCTAGSQRYYEDCQVCCAPIELMIHIDEDNDQVIIEAQRDNS